MYIELKSSVRVPTTEEINTLQGLGYTVFHIEQLVPVALKTDTDLFLGGSSRRTLAEQLEIVVKEENRVRERLEQVRVGMLPDADYRILEKSLLEQMHRLPFRRTFPRGSDQSRSTEGLKLGQYAFADCRYDWIGVVPVVIFPVQEKAA